jgi:hypothetical protein
MANPTTEFYIEKALLDAAAAAAATLNLSIQMPNVDFPTPDVAYLEAVHFINQNANPNWSDETIYQGILQINFITPDHRGSFDPAEVCGKIVTLFDKGTILWTGEHGDVAIKIDAKPSRLTIIQEGSKATYPVSISYVCRP